MEWVSVKERLPEVGTEVLGASKGAASGSYRLNVLIHVDENDHDWQFDGCEIANCWTVTHWMFLPEPPNK